MFDKVYAPNVHLFAFHAHKVLAGDANSNEGNINYLWDKCNRILTALGVNKKFNRENLTSYQKSEPPGTRIDLIVPEKVGNRRSLPFEKTIQQGNVKIPIKGFALPKRISDSYALGLNIRVPEKEAGQKTEPVDISIFKQFNPSNCLFNPNHYSLPLDPNLNFLGQTILITITLTDEQNEAAAKTDSNFLKNLADKCLESLIQCPLKTPTFSGEGKLFGSPIFEYGSLSQIEDSWHILIWLFTNPTTSERLFDCYNDLLELLLYRNKILHTYHERDKIYYVTRDEYEQIEQIINETFENLNKEKSYPQRLSQNVLQKLNTQLMQMPTKAVEYARLLRDIEIRQHTLNINTQNYKDKVSKIRTYLKSKSDPLDLKFLETFSKETCVTFQKQITADLGYFQHGSGLLDTAINSIRGMVDIEEAQRDRDLQVTVQALGFGLATAGVVATSIPYLIKAEPENYPIRLPFTTRAINFPTSEIHPFSLVLLMSLGAGLLGARLGVWAVVSGVMNLKRIVASVRKLVGFQPKLPPKQDKPNSPDKDKDPELPA
ncbi:hypothetical protein [Microcoleus sp. FACHB-68]|uniref:hypothetical protein n=1 Tax=Microcoleus sp. FACHB-68 TaxID=2692826 RepID=UPI0016851772|nr:hypothetical protein [Microcoleus sp. FACHB-68]MBD1940382.1 hypothetical protein [Microcoleus sp. FACHB-68]